VGAHFLWPTGVPGDLHLHEPEPSRYFSSGALAGARSYERFLRINGLLSVVALVAVLVFYAKRGARFTRESAAGRVGTGMLLGMLGFAVVWIAELPFGLAEVWWERRHGVSKVGYLDWAVSSWLGLGGVFLFVCAAIGIVMALAGPMRNRWWIAAVPVFIGLSLLFAFVSPFLMTELRPLHDPQLEAAADRYERQQDLPDIPVKVAEVKEFTTAPNAEAAGLGPSRRVILWDTLLGKPFDDKEIDVVLAHELGHHSRNHIWKGFGWSALFAFPVAFAIALGTRRRGGMYDPRAVPLALLITVVLQIAIAPVANVVTRRFESEADWISLQTTRDPASTRAAFVDLAKTSKADPQPPTWSYVLDEDHPTIMQRIAMADAWAARYGGSGR
jgi:Zn-dependent protease with chaperone function